MIRDKAEDMGGNKLKLKTAGRDLYQEVLSLLTLHTPLLLTYICMCVFGSGENSHNFCLKVSSLKSI